MDMTLLVGEGGLFLSGGQKQRIALARAIYDDPVLFVLDEPNSNLDEAGELALLQALVQLKAAKKTIFVITHRTAILRVVDKVLLLVNGVSQAFGPRDEVLAPSEKGAGASAAAGRAGGSGQKIRWGIFQGVIWRVRKDKAWMPRTRCL